MRTLYYHKGCGYLLEKATLNEEAQEALDNWDLEKVLQYMIDTDQGLYYKCNDYDNYDVIAEDCVYIDNTTSHVYDKKDCYIFYIGNMKTELTQQA